MGQRQAILAQLKKSRNLAVERVVDAALAFERPPESPDAPAGAAALAAVLLGRDRRPGWVALIRHFARLGETVQRELIERPRDLFGPLAESIDQTTGDARENVIRIVRQAADAKLVYLLAETLMDARAEVRELAADSLLDAIRRFRTRGHLSPAAAHEPGSEAPALQRAIDLALTRFKTHRQARAFHAALLMERRVDGPTWAHATDQYAEATRAGTVILRAPADPLLAPALFLALASPLRAAAVHGLTTADGPEVARALARESFRLIDPALAQGAEMVSHLRGLASPKRDVPWDAQTWPDYLRLIERLGLPAAHKLAWLARMIDSPDGTPVQRMAALRVVSDLDAPEAVQVLAAHVADPDERVARVAARELLARKRHDAKAYAEAFAGSPHASVRHMAAVALGPSRFDRHWKDYSRLPPAIQVNNTRTLAAREMTFAEKLRAKLESPQAADALQGLRLLHTLPDLAPYRADVIRLCASADARVVASAVRALGRLGDPAVLDLLEAAARHGDPRVRANAVEAMEALNVANRSRQVLAMLNSRHNRERANAIKAISAYDFVTARQTLCKMLVDPNPMHRVSALWVVDQLAILDLVRQVTTLARRDANPHVRARALELLDRMTAAAQPQA